MTKIWVLKGVTRGFKPKVYQTYYSKSDAVFDCKDLNDHEELLPNGTVYWVEHSTEM